MRQIVSLSGGKDSTAMLLMMLERGEQIDDIVFFDWGMEFEAMYEHLERLETYIGRSITRLYPRDGSWRYWMLGKGRRNGNGGYGWPHGKARWCSREKADTVNRQYRSSVMCIGFAYEERFSRAHPANRWQEKCGITVRYPLLEWGVSETEALKYCYSHGFDFGGLYRLFKRVSCWCCPFQLKRELLALRDNFPDLWARLLDMDSRSPYPWPNDNLAKLEAK